MSKKIGIIVGVIVVLLAITGFAVYKTIFSGPAQQPSAVQDLTQAPLPPADASIQVAVVKSSAPNSVVIRVSGLAAKMSTVAYELTYESKGLVKGVNSGSKPLDVAGKETLEREIYLGTCSKNVCTPDTGISKVSVSLVFTDTSGKQTQFSRDYTL